jgi:hypothetical protein
MYLDEVGLAGIDLEKPGIVETATDRQDLETDFGRYVAVKSKVDGYELLKQRPGWTDPIQGGFVCPVLPRCDTRRVR